MVTRIEESDLVPSLTRITDDAEHHYYWTHLLDLWGVPTQMKHFPGSHPVPVNDETLSALHGGDYVVALKTDGVRCLLFLTLQPDKVEPVALMIDRSLTMYEVSIWANYDFFEQGTLYDGELAWNLGADGAPNNTMSYCVFDVIAVCGKNVTQCPFAERLQTIHDTLFRAWKTMTDDEMESYVRDEKKVVCRQQHPYSINMVPKACAPFTNVEALWATRNECGQRTDGLLFTCRSAPMAIGRTDKILKWKPHHTIDVGLRRLNGGGWETLVSRSSTAARSSQRKASRRRRDDENVGNLRITDTEFVSFADELRRVAVVEDNDITQNLETHTPEISGNEPTVYIVECNVVSCNDTHVRLFPTRHRTDKREANAPATIRSTLQIRTIDIDEVARKKMDTPSASNRRTTVRYQ